MSIVQEKTQQLMGNASQPATPIYIEPVAVEPMALDLALPWTLHEVQERKFKRAATWILVLLLILSIAIPFLPIFEPDYEEPETDLVVTKLILKPVIEPAPVIEEKPKPIKEPEQVVKEIPKPKEVVSPKPKVAQIKKPTKTKSKSAEKTAVKADKVEEKVSVKTSQGLDDLSKLLAKSRSSVNVKRLANKNVSDNKLGSAARSSRQVLGDGNISRKSGGVTVDGNLLTNSSTSLASHTTTAVDGLVADGLGASGNQAYASSQQGQRTTESIRRTFERTKSRVNALYYQALIEQPNLSGEFAFKIRIEPDGLVSNFELISSALRDKSLVSKIAARVKRIDFGREDVPPRDIEYTFQFFPS